MFSSAPSGPKKDGSAQRRVGPHLHNCHRATGGVVGWVDGRDRRGVRHGEGVVARGVLLQRMAKRSKISSHLVEALLSLVWNF